MIHEFGPEHGKMSLIQSYQKLKKCKNYTCWLVDGL